MRKLSWKKIMKKKIVLQIEVKCELYYRNCVIFIDFSVHLIAIVASVAILFIIAYCRWSNLCVVLCGFWCIFFVRFVLYCILWIREPNWKRLLRSMSLEVSPSPTANTVKLTIHISFFSLYFLPLILMFYLYDACNSSIWL